MITNQEDRITADKLTFNEHTFTIYSAGGGEYEIPYAVSPRLLLATPAERVTGKLMLGGYGIEWEALDEHLSVDGLIHGRISTETWRSIYEWYEMRREEKDGVTPELRVDGVKVSLVWPQKNDNADKANPST